MEEERNISKKTELIKWFSKLNQNLDKLAGKKGANLGEINNLKIQVPIGFVITTNSYENFINEGNLTEKINLILNEINEENKETIENAKEKIKSLFSETEFPKRLKYEITENYDALDIDGFDFEKGSALEILNKSSEPPFVAVRPSNTKNDSIKTPLEDEQTTYLNVKGIGKLLTVVKNCFAYFTIMNYLNQKKGSLAIIVQLMVNSDKSGVIFSNDSENNNIKIESVWGLGGREILKKSTPDKYLLSENLDLIDKQINKKEIAITRNSSGEKIEVKLTQERANAQVLKDYEIKRLGMIAKKLENHFKKPQKISFAIEGENIFILSTKEQKNEPKIEEREIQKEEEIGIKPTKEEINAHEEFMKQEKENNSENIEPITNETKTKVDLIIDIPSCAKNASKTNIKRVGLTRLEGIISESKKHPNYFLERNEIEQYENLIYNGVKEISEFFEEIWVRTPDIRTDEFEKLEGTPKLKEKNPMLGLHGIRYSLKNPTLLKAELRALKRISKEETKIGILLPQIISPKEIKKVKRILQEIDFSEAKLGTMIETPASVQMIREICETGIEFVSIGTNDLTQYILAVDRKNDQVENLYNEMHPAILRQIRYVLRTCKKYNVQSNLCGKVANKKEMIDFLIQNKINAITVEASNAKEVSDYIAKLEKESQNQNIPKIKPCKKEKELEEKIIEGKAEIEEIEEEIENPINQEEPSKEIPEQERIALAEDQIKQVQKEIEEIRKYEEDLEKQRKLEENQVKLLKDEKELEELEKIEDELVPKEELKPKEDISEEIEKTDKEDLVSHKVAVAEEEIAKKIASKEENQIEENVTEKEMEIAKGIASENLKDEIKKIDEKEQNLQVTEEFLNVEKENINEEQQKKHENEVKEKSAEDLIEGLEDEENSNERKNELDIF